MDKFSEAVHPESIDLLHSLLCRNSGPLLVHTDLVRASGGVTKGLARLDMLYAHSELLSRAAEERTIWMPAFNYDFVRSQTFSVHDDASQVGVLTEHFRRESAAWRTPVPVFSVSGTGPAPRVCSGPRIDPFGADSIFARLAEQNGSILFYGAGINSCTFIHHAERAAGGPIYRYDKSFTGTVVEDVSRTVELLYHVRPQEDRLDYDWSRLELDLFENGLLRRIEKGMFVVASVQAAPLLSFWSERLAADPLYPLDRESRAWVEPKIQELGRGFLLTDFECAEHGEDA